MAAKQRAAIGQAPASLAEWERKREALGEYRRVLAERQALFGQLQAGGQTPPAAELERLKEELNYADSVERLLAGQRQKLQLAQIDANYRDMERKRAQLLDAYTRAFGSAQERPALQTLISHLERMLENRTAAEGLGEGAAAAQASRLRTEIDKLKKR